MRGEFVWRLLWPDGLLVCTPVFIRSIISSQMIDKADILSVGPTVLIAVGDVTQDMALAAIRRLLH